VNNTPWAEDELADIGLSWSEWSARHQVETEEGMVPSRSYDAWRHKRKALKEGHLPTPKRVVHHFVEPTVTDEEWFDLFIKFQEDTADPTYGNLHHEVDVITDEPIIVCFPSDWHIGNKGTDHRKLRDDVNLIASHPRVYCAVGGDPCDNFIWESMIHASRSQAIHPPDQWRIFRSLTRKLVESQSLLWVSSGNHDAWTTQAAGLDPVMAYLLDIPVVHTKEGGFIHLRVGNQIYVIFRKHKPVKSKSGKNPLHFLKEMLRNDTPIEFDIGVSEHIHEPVYEKFEYRPGSKIDRVVIACGTYKLKDPYAQDLGYFGGGYGVPAVILYPDRRRMIPFMSISEALEALDGVSFTASAA
jgi:hypothetical protein